MSWWALPSYLRHCNCDWLNHTTWSNGSCQHIPRGMVAAILFPADQVMCDWLNHTTWFHSNRALPRSKKFESMLLHFFTKYSMLFRLFDDRKYMDIYLLIPQEYCYLGKQKNSLYFLTSACEQLWPSHSHLVNCAKWEQIASKYVSDWSVLIFFF